AALYAAFGNKGGGPKSEGYYNPYNSDAYYSSNSSEAAGASRTVAQGLQSQYDAIAKAYGSTAALQFGVGFSTDPKGKAASQVHVAAGSNGQSLFNLSRTDVGCDEQVLQKALGAM